MSSQASPDTKARALYRCAPVAAAALSTLDSLPSPLPRPCHPPPSLHVPLSIALPGRGALEEIAALDTGLHCHVRGLSRNTTRASLALGRSHPNLTLLPALAPPDAPGTQRALASDARLSLADARALAALTAAVQGASALFLVTFSDFERLGAEALLGGLMARAALDAGVRHIALSGGMRTGQPALDAKADLEDALRALPFAAAHYLHSGFFFENFVLKGGAPRLTCAAAEGESATHVTFQSPFPADWPIVMHAASDIGRVAMRRLWAGAAPGQGSDVVRLAGSRVTGAAFAEAVSVAARRQLQLDLRAEYAAIPVDKLRRALPGQTGRALCG